MRNRWLAACLLVLCAGCNEQQGNVAGTSVFTQTLKNFTLGIDRGVFTHDLLIVNKNPLPITEVHVVITAKYEDGTTPRIERYWADWPNGEEKKINVTSGNIQSVTLEGDCQLHGRKALLKAEWPDVRPRPKKP